jgi:hypothetical protein
METSGKTLAVIFVLGLSLGFVAGWKTRQVLVRNLKDG